MAIEVSPLGRADNRQSVNSSGWIQNPVMTVNGSQWAAWWDTAGHPIVATRALDGAWATRDLHNVAGNALDSPVAKDGHNSLSVGVDPDGRVHVAGNMHNNPMRYLRSDSGDIDGAWTAEDSPGGDIDHVTYPKFFHAGGDLCLVYRDGGSGSGDIWFERWDGTAWSQTLIVDGRVSGENFYLQRVAVRGDDVHLAGVWRDTPDPTTTEDPSHMMSRDGGVTWETINGSSLTLPVTHSTIDIIVDTATGVGLVGSCGMDVDGDGNPHIVMLIDGGGGETRLWYATWNGGWSTATLASDWTHVMPFDPRDWSVAVPHVVCHNGRVYAITRNNVDAPDQIELRDITGGQDGPRGPVLAVNTYAYFPSIEVTSTHFRMSVTPTRTPDPSHPDYDAVDFSDQPIALVSVPKTDLTAIVNANIEVPDSLAGTPPSDTGKSVATLQRRVVWLGCDVAGGDVIAELPDLTGRVSRLLGADASSSASTPIPLSGPGYLGPPGLQATEPHRTMLVAVVNDVPAWAGWVLRREGGTSATLDLGCVTPEGYLGRRFIRNHTFTQVDESIVMSMLAQDAEDIGGLGRGLGLVHAVTPSGNLVDADYLASDHATVLDRMQERSRANGGVEWTIDPEWSDNNRRAVRLVLRIAPRIGSSVEGPVFDVFDSPGGAAVEYSLAEDWSDGRGANYVVAYGVGEGDDQPVSDPAVDQPALSSGAPIVERHWQPSSSISNKPPLDRHAAAELERRRNGTRTWSVRARWDRYPHYGVDWRLGDTVRLEVVGHRHPDGASVTVRTIGWDLDLAAGLIEPKLEPV